MSTQLPIEKHPVEVSSHQGVTVGGVMVTFWVVVITHFMADLVGGVWSVFKTIAELDLQKAGVIATVTGVVAMALQPAFGFWAERGGRRNFLIAGVALAGVGFLFSPIVMLKQWVGDGVMYVLLAVAMSAVGLGLAMFHPAATAIAGGINPKRRAATVAIFVAAGSSGFACGQLVFTKLYLLLNGHTEIVLIFYALVIVALLLWCRPVRTHQPEHHNFRKTLATFRVMWKQLIVLYLILSSVAALAAGFLFLLPEFILMKGYSQELAYGGAHFFFIFGGSLTMIPMCHLADKFGRKRMLVAFLFLAAISYFGLLLMPQVPWWIFAACCFVTGACLNTCNPLGVSFGQHLFPNHTSTISGILMGLAWALGNFSPAAVAYMADIPELGIVRGLMVLGAVIVFAAVLSLWLPRTQR